MKKFVTVFICMLVVLSITSVCSAGDIPEALLWSDKAQVYFGEIKALDGDSITVIQRKNIKGEFTQDSELTYKRFGFTESPKIGVIYLCGYFDQNNPLYVWDVSSMDTKTLIIKNAGDMSKRMQDYLNAGKFEVKEEERLAKIKTQTDPASSTVVLTTVITSRRIFGGPWNNLLIILVVSGALLIGIVLFVLIKNRLKSK